jgi:carboxyl-terminal processing protease
LPRKDVLMFTRRSFTGLLTLLILASLLLGGWVGNKVHAARDTAYENLRLFNDVFNNVMAKYVEPVEPQKLIFGAIRGMLGTLDPHTQFLDPDEYRDLMIGTHGSYGGLGIQISVRDEALTVIAPIEGSPAYRAGIQAGDQIAKINGKSTKGITEQDAMKQLRGPKGTQVTLTIQREGTPEPSDYTLTRDVINLESISYAGIVKPGIGYIRLSSFSEKAGEEVNHAIDSLEQAGMKSLILDLRGNPGGLLAQAVSVSENFLDKGQRVVFTKGRLEDANKEYFIERGTKYGKFPLVVLVDQGSASASEIVAGAVQDWDRGLIVGKTSFGKGSVQNVIQLSEESALKLTTAKYYTPSGRCIHKDNGGGEDSTKAEQNVKKDVYYTLGGLKRAVYGGGGITPDLPVENQNLSKFSQGMVRYFFGYAVKYASVHKHLTEDFSVTDQMVDDFKKYLTEKKVTFTPEDFKANEDYILFGIHFSLMSNLFGDKATYATGVRFEKDDQFQKAVEVLAKSRTLSALLALGTSTEKDKK